MPRIASNPHGRIQRDSPEERYLELLGGKFAASLTKDVSCHVLDDPQYWHLELLERRGGPGGIRESYRLRRGDHHTAGHRYQLRQRKVSIAGARRHVNHQVVHLLPCHIFQELLHRRMEQCPTPEERFSRRYEEANGHHLKTISTQRHELLVLHHGRSADAKHDVHVRPVNVRIQDAYFRTPPGEGYRQVDRDRGFAHPTLATGYSDHVPDRRIQL